MLEREPVTSPIDGGCFPLTTKKALFRFNTVFRFLMNQGLPIQRYVGAGILLFVFFLPLHFHAVAATAQVAKECSCLHGSRTESGLSPAPAVCAPLLTAQPIASEIFDCFSTVRFQIHGIRAPPITPSR